MNNLEIVMMNNERKHNLFRLLVDKINEMSASYESLLKTAKDNKSDEDYEESRVVIEVLNQLYDVINTEKPVIDWDHIRLLISFGHRIKAIKALEETGHVGFRVAHTLVQKEENKMRYGPPSDYTVGVAQAHFSWSIHSNGHFITDVKGNRQDANLTAWKLSLSLQSSKVEK